MEINIRGKINSPQSELERLTNLWKTTTTLEKIEETELQGFIQYRNSLGKNLQPIDNCEKLQRGLAEYRQWKEMISRMTGYEGTD